MPLPLHMLAVVAFIAGVVLVVSLLLIRKGIRDQERDTDTVTPTPVGDFSRCEEFAAHIPTDTSYLDVIEDDERDRLIV